MPSSVPAPTNGQRRSAVVYARVSSKDQEREGPDAKPVHPVMAFELHSRSPAAGAPRAASGTTDSELAEARDVQGPDGCGAVTNRTGAGTGGGAGGTSGWTPRRGA